MHCGEWCHIQLSSPADQLPPSVPTCLFSHFQQAQGLHEGLAVVKQLIQGMPQECSPASHPTQQTHELSVLSIFKPHRRNLHVRLQLQVPARCELLSHNDHLNLIIAICDDNTYIVDPFSNNKKDIMIKLVGISLMTLLRFSIFEKKLVWVCLYFLTAPSAGFIALPYVFKLLLWLEEASLACNMHECILSAFELSRKQDREKKRKQSCRNYSLLSFT